MADWHPYSDRLTERETKLGFQRLAVKNPHGDYAYNQPTKEAVVLPLGVSDRLVKVNVPSGQVAYFHERFGSLGGSSRNEWHRVQGPFATPEEAVQVDPAGPRVVSDLTPTVTPCDPGPEY